MRREVRKTQEIDERCIQVFVKKFGHFEDLGVNGNIIKIDFKYQLCESVDWINLT
jgi:hypothetical protein